MPTNFDDTHFQPLEAFPLSWRWSSPAHRVLPERVLLTIRAFTPEMAAVWAEEALVRCGDGGGDGTTFDATGGDGTVKERLEGLGISGSEEILVVWDAQHAVTTTWETFRDYWSDFCYPSSDDVAIWSPAGSWVLCYDHSEQFRFQKGR